MIKRIQKGSTPVFVKENSIGSSGTALTGRLNEVFGAVINRLIQNTNTVIVDNNTKDNNRSQANTNKYSLEMVDPILPLTNKWERGATTEMDVSHLQLSISLILTTLYIKLDFSVR